jgi:hypothetical protein
MKYFFIKKSSILRISTLQKINKLVCKINFIIKNFKVKAMTMTLLKN